ncbi:ABC-type glucosylglycerol transport system permease protein [Janibacter sp. HTCC2649]|uniref:carbohydrate ABC transporter permease n=1 Tax=Janibacter sp. HTCC2649 TaxID=313589 RepID=UPI000066ED63|nr:sugar ABC transporter permease [Janibacter sp. HTCC2649]EAP98850.1 ABC-type glucosylglycerol transport system permease protein [Janibacter sp. HTCC2649]
MLVTSFTAISTDTNSGKLLTLLLGLVVFGAVFLGILLLASLFNGRIGEKIQAAAFVGPTLIFISIALIYPFLLTIRRAFYDGKFFDLNFGTARTRGEFVGLDNFQRLWTTPGLPDVFRNTLFWVVLVPLVSTGLGLLYALLIDRAKGEAVAKALIFLPMAISMVGATLIWKFVYFFIGDPGAQQVGLLNTIVTKLGMDPIDFLGNAPGNTFAMIAIMIWIQVGFAMTILSAAIKAIPDEILEAANMDGVSGVKMFRFITLPSIRASVIVVMTTIGIATLKAFDIVQTSSGGKLGDSVLANEFYNRSFVTQEPGLGAAIAIVIFLLVSPIIVFNVIQLRKDA